MSLKHISEITETVIAGIAGMHLALKSANKLRNGDAVSAEMYADLAAEAFGWDEPEKRIDQQFPPNLKRW